jgi:hypothetical protein
VPARNGPFFPLINSGRKISVCIKNKIKTELRFEVRHLFKKAKTVLSLIRSKKTNTPLSKTMDRLMRKNEIPIETLKSKLFVGDLGDTDAKILMANVVTAPMTPNEKSRRENKTLKACKSAWKVLYIRQL